MCLFSILEEDISLLILSFLNINVVAFYHVKYKWDMID